jgi:hypothetical protein
MKKEKDIYVEIAIKLLHYSPFSIQHKRTENYFKKRKYSSFELVIRADMTLNQQDNDVFKSLLKLMQIAHKENSISKQTITIRDNPDNPANRFTVAGAKFYLSDIVNLSQSKWTFVVDSLERLQTLQIKYKNSRYTIRSTPLPKIVIDEKDKTVNVFFDYDLFQKSITKETALTQNLTHFVSLRSNVAKALYDFITANSSIRTFREDTLFKRLDLDAQAKFRAREWLKQAWQELKDNYIIKDYSICKKNGMRYYTYEPY